MTGSTWVGGCPLAQPWFESFWDNSALSEDPKNSADALVTPVDGAQPLVLQDDQHAPLLPALGPRLLLQRGKSTSLLRTAGRQALYIPFLR